MIIRKLENLGAFRRSSTVPACRQAGSESLLRGMTGWYVYAIKSQKDGRIYVGISRSPQRRLLEHNRGDTKSTKGYRPWRIIYQKQVGSRIEARREEKRLKSGYGKEFLRNIPA